MPANTMQGFPDVREKELEAKIIAALRRIFDPEIPVNIYDLGLVYAIDFGAGTNDVSLRMTLTAAGCPVAQTFPATVREAVQSVDGVGNVSVDLVWDPPWSQDMMSEAARLQLGLL